MDGSKSCLYEVIGYHLLPAPLINSQPCRFPHRTSFPSTPNTISKVCDSSEMSDVGGLIVGACVARLPSTGSTGMCLKMCRYIKCEDTRSASEMQSNRLLCLQQIRKSIVKYTSNRIITKQAEGDDRLYTKRPHVPDPDPPSGPSATKPHCTASKTSIQP